MRVYAVTFQKSDKSGRLPFQLVPSGQLAIYPTSVQAHEALAEVLGYSRGVSSYARKTIRVDPLDLTNPLKTDG